MLIIGADSQRVLAVLNGRDPLLLPPGSGLQFGDPLGQLVPPGEGHGRIVTAIR